MTERDLIFVKTIADEGSISRAAHKLYISQPSLSVSIRKLEEELGEPLFVRNSNGIALTPFGIELLPFIQDIVSLYDQMPLQVYGKAAKNTLRISVANGGFRFFAEAIGKLYRVRKKDGIHIEFHDVPPEESLAMVIASTVQIGGFTIWSFQKESIETRLRRSGVRFVPLGLCCPAVSVGPKNPLWERKEDWVTQSMIQSFPIVYSFTEHSNMLLRMLGLYNKGNLITCKERAGRGELLLHTDAICVSAFPSQAYHHANCYPDRRIFRLLGYDLTNEFGYILNQSYAPSRIVLEFIDILSEFVVDDV